VLLSSGCQQWGDQRWTRTELYFGLTRHDGSVISDADWSRFVDEQVTPRFPDGLTIVAAEGRFREGQRTLAEPSRMGIILHPPSREADEKIDTLAKAYARQFEQESVLRADSKSRVSFISR